MLLRLLAVTLGRCPVNVETALSLFGTPYFTDSTIFSPKSPKSNEYALMFPHSRLSIIATRCKRPSFGVYSNFQTVSLGGWVSIGKQLTKLYASPSGRGWVAFDGIMAMHSVASPSKFVAFPSSLGFSAVHG